MEKNIDILLALETMKIASYSRWAGKTRLFDAIGMEAAMLSENWIAHYSCRVGRGEC